MALFRPLRTAVTTLLLVGLLALNILTVTVDAVFSTLSALAEAVDVGTVRGRQAGRLRDAETRLGRMTAERDRLRADTDRLRTERDRLRRPSLVARHVRHASRRQPGLRCVALA